MESASLGILFGCAGAALVFFGTRRYVRARCGQNGPAPDGTDAAIKRAYERLFQLRLGCLILSLAAAGIWLLEPRPYIPGALVGVACLLLWKAWRVRSALLRQVRAETEKAILGQAAKAAGDQSGDGKTQGREARKNAGLAKGVSLV